MDLHAALSEIRRAHSLAILALEGGEVDTALERLSWVEAELVVLTEVSIEHADQLRLIAAQQRDALAAFREGRLDDSLGMIRGVLSAIEAADENISRGRDPADESAIHPN